MWNARLAILSYLIQSLKEIRFEKRMYSGLSGLLESKDNLDSNWSSLFNSRLVQ